MCAQSLQILDDKGATGYGLQTVIFQHTRTPEAAELRIKLRIFKTVTCSSSPVADTLRRLTTGVLPAMNLCRVVCFMAFCNYTLEAFSV